MIQVVPINNYLNPPVPVSASPQSCGNEFSLPHQVSNASQVSISSSSELEIELSRVDLFLETKLGGGVRLTSATALVP